MRISSKSKVAFQVLLDIAAHTAAGYAISMPQICRRHKLSRSYLENIIGALRAIGIIRSHRGPGGGFSLARKPEAVTLKEVVSLMGDQEAVREDLGAGLWANLDSYMSLQMEKINLSQTLKSSAIMIEKSTRGAHTFTMDLSIKVEPRASSQKLSQTAPKKHKPRLGPNSVFTFGKYLKST